MTPKVSVVLPVYNGEKYLESALASLVNQSYKNLEILVINDGSTDASAAIAQKFVASDPRVILLNQENQGVSAARNLGLNHATGDYLGFLDADDFIETDAYELMVKTAEEYAAEMVVCGFYRYYNESASPALSSVKAGLYTGAGLAELNRELVYPTKKHYFHAYLWNRLIKRSSVENIGLRFDREIKRSEDYLFLVTLATNIRRLYVLGDKKAYYRQHSESITHSYLQDYWPMVQAIYERLAMLDLPQDRLNLMLVARGRNAVYQEALATDSLRNRYRRCRKIVKDLILRRALKGITFQEGKKQIGLSFYFFKLRLVLPLFLLSAFNKKRLTGGKQDGRKA